MVSISIPMSNIWICIVSHLHQPLDLLKFLIFANVVGVKYYPVMVLICILLLTGIIENLFIGFWCFCVCFAVNRKCLFISLINFLCGHLLFSFVFARTFYEIVHCFHLFNFKCLEGKRHTFFIVISPAMSIMTQLDSSLFCR